MILFNVCNEIDQVGIRCFRESGGDGCRDDKSYFPVFELELKLY